MTALTQAEIIDLLRQHVQGGCTDVLADAPVNHFAAQAAAPVPDAPPQAEQIPQAQHRRQAEQAAPQGLGESAAPIAAAPQAPSATLARPVTASAPVKADDNALQTAAELAAKADTLEALHAAMAGFDGCGLKTTAKNLVFSDGVATADIMVIGEAPGQDEDRQGKPFVGRAGQLLDAMLGAIGLERSENLYITNVVPWRPPGNRTPSLDEIALCKPFITRHIELVQPKILLLIGNISNKTLLDTSIGITKLRGQWQDYESAAGVIKALPLLHPAYVLRRPETKTDVWADLCRLKQELLNA